MSRGRRRDRRRDRGRQSELIVGDLSTVYAVVFDGPAASHRLSTHGTVANGTA
jgi:hypothetical protein